MLSCSRCGRRADYEDRAAGVALCIRCLARSTKRRVIKELKKKLRRSDSITFVCRGDVQSRYLVEVSSSLLAALTQAEVKILELSTNPICEDLGKERIWSYEVTKPEPRTYTQYRLILLDLAEEKTTLVMPDALEDIAVYAAGELLLGDLRGLALDGSTRVVYPLASVSIKAIIFLMPHLAGRLPRMYLRSPARTLIEELSRSTPTLPYSILSMWKTIVSLLYLTDGKKLE